MDIATGQTIYEMIRSFDANSNNPIVPATLVPIIYKNGVIDSGTTVNIFLSDTTEGMYTASWSASTFGTYQLHVENNTTDVVYVSEIYIVKSDSEINPSPTIYVGL